MVLEYEERIHVQRRVLGEDRIEPVLSAVRTDPAEMGELAISSRCDTTLVRDNEGWKIIQNPLIN